MITRDIEKISSGQFDLLVIGGGINGAAIANLAAFNGLKTVLIEKGDFASGTSSKSTKLIHGGLRYLENLDFGLVKESLKERAIQLKRAPHLVSPLKIIIPVYKEDMRPFWMMKLGVMLYDILSGKYSIGKHQTLTVDQVLEKIPNIKQEGLIGGVMYYDAKMDDARLCLENVLSAVEQGATAVNYVEATEVLKENGKAVGVKAKDVLHHSSFEIRAKKIICAAGPWTNQFLKREFSRAENKVRTTKGVHIVYKEKLAQEAMFIPCKDSRRLFFVIPFGKHSLIGTTDTDFEQNPDIVTTGQEDIDYLFDEMKRVFPKREFNTRNIVTTFAGLRPLVKKGGSPSKVSRKHVVEESFTKIIYVYGGKYTTYRKIAADALTKIIEGKVKDGQEDLPLIGNGEISQTPQKIAEGYGVSEDVAKWIIGIYGSRYNEVLDLTIEDPSLKEKICKCSPTIKAQVAYAVHNEMAQTPHDVYDRRLSLQYHACSSKDCFKEIEKIFKI